MIKLILGSVVAASFAFTSLAGAQDYPARPIEMIIPFTAGSGLDINGRAVAKALSDELKQSVVVINREGAGGTVGFGALAAARPDGHTIGFGPTTPISTSPFIVKGVRYTPESFSFVCQLFETVFVLAVGPHSKFKTFEEVIAAAKANPKSLTYGSAGLGTIPHLSMENMSDALGVQFQHVPYRGDGPLLPALLKGELDLAAVAIATVREQPSIRALATFSDERQPVYSNTPTVKELGVLKSVPPGHVGIFAQKDIPAPVQKSLERACEKANANADVQRVIQTTGQSPKFKSGSEFQQATSEDYPFKKQLIKNLKLDVD